MQKINTFFMSFPYASLTSLMWHEEQRLSTPRCSASKSSCLCCLRGAKGNSNQHMGLVLLLAGGCTKTRHFKARHHLASSGISAIPQRCALTSPDPPITHINPRGRIPNISYQALTETHRVFTRGSLGLSTPKRPPKSLLFIPSPPKETNESS